MAKRRKRSDQVAVEFEETDISVPNDENVYGSFGTSDLSGNETEVSELSGISARQEAVQRYEDARVRDDVSDEELKELEAEIERLKTQNEQSIIFIDERRWKFHRFEMTPTELVFPKDITSTEWEQFGNMLAGMDSAVQFWIGDWANIYIRDEKDDNVRGDMYKEIADKFGYSHRSIKNYASVCRLLEVSLRRDTLSFTIHRMVAECPISLKGREDELLNWAEEHQPTSRDFARYMKELIDKKRIDTPVLGQDNFLFSKTRKPKITVAFEKAWAKARNGDGKQKAVVIEEISKMRKWLEEVEDSLDE